MTEVAPCLVMTAQLMDFGIAKLLPKNTTERAKYHMTGGVGSLRYSAPEVANNLLYDQSADVYSEWY